MCFQNYTQHSGCGHYSETYHNHFTPCTTAFAILSSSRGPSSPPLSPPPEFFPPSSTSTLKRSGTTTSSKQRRFFSLSNMLQRSNTTATAPSTSSSRRAVSGPEPGVSRTSTSSFTAQGLNNDFGIPDHELIATASACPELKKRTLVSSGGGGQVCKGCARWLGHMRSMLEGYDKGRGIRGTPAFKRFLEDTEVARETAHMLGFFPAPGPAEGTSLGVGR
ncbi:hypothetical protein CC80DRAFT_485441 [Byssothecium circinans]|uniref:Uncharacterized protein n=1 Tax=Byssothecium circinans TaxID=147558 RepID=A0A6A5T9M0_9PLEO|nr:hypothetical protein CC80DRAFT_485441 [Byssothecium circinans]